MHHHDTTAAHTFTRREFLAAGTGAAMAATLAACGATSQSSLIGPHSAQVDAAEVARRASGRTTVLRLVPRVVTADLGGRTVSTWAYQEALAGPEIRVRPGDRLDVTVANRLPEPTSIHWHGLAIDNAFDGVPGLTQAPIGPGASFRYHFVVPDAGTYWYHSHHGLQLDRGLYGPLVVEDPADPGVDVDQVLVLDDWLDGMPATPDRTLAQLRQTMGGMDSGAAMGSMGATGSPSGRGSMGAESPTGQASTGTMTSSLLGGDAGDVAYPLHLVNGRPPTDRPTVVAPVGGRIRLRLVNAGSDTAYRVAVGGHRLTVTHADGRPVHPVTVDTVLIGMGERYDVTIAARYGTWPIYASAEGKNAYAAAVLRTSDAGVISAPPPSTRPNELDGQLLRYQELRPAEGASLPARTPDRNYSVTLNGGMASYDWSLGGDAHRLAIRRGERVRLTLRNRSRMWHPMHLHGHTFSLARLGGVRKDTVNVRPLQAMVIDFDADNPGQWMLHCHNTYHLAMGMAATVSYRT